MKVILVASNTVSTIKSGKFEMETIPQIAQIDSVLKMVFIDGVTSEILMKNKQNIAAKKLIDFHFLSKICFLNLKKSKKICGFFFRGESL